MNFVARIKEIGLKNIAAAVLGMGLVTMAGDAGIAHFAGRGGIKDPGQLIPVAFGVLALSLLGVLLKPSERVFRRLVRSVAGSAIAVGLIGTTYHAVALLKVLTAGGTFDGSLLGVAMVIAPPLLAPGAFAGLGTALWFLASPRIDLALTEERRSALATAA